MVNMFWVLTFDFNRWWLHTRAWQFKWCHYQHWCLEHTHSPWCGRCWSWDGHMLSNNQSEEQRPIRGKCLEPIRIKDIMLHSPVHVEDGWEVLWVFVKEILRHLARDKLLTQLQHLSVNMIVKLKSKSQSKSLCPNIPSSKIWLVKCCHKNPIGHRPVKPTK